MSLGPQAEALLKKLTDSGTQPTVRDNNLLLLAVYRDRKS